MNYIKCVPFLGTSVSALQCIGALIEGDFKRAGCRLVETVVDGALDATIVYSGGLAALITTPGKIGGKAAVKAVLQKVATTGIRAVVDRTIIGATADVVASNNRHQSNGFSQYYTPIYRSSIDCINQNDVTYGSGSNTNKNSTSSAGGGGDDERNFNGKKQGEHEREEGVSIFNYLFFS